MINKKIKIAILSSYTAQNLKNHLNSHLQKNGFEPEIQFGGYNQYNQELRDKSSWLYAFNPDVAVIALSSKTFLQEVEFEILSKGYEATLKECKEKISFLLDSLSQYSLAAKIILTSLDQPLYSPFDLMDLKMPDGIYALVQEGNNLLREFAHKHPGIILLDFDRICSLVGKNNMTNEQLYYLGKIFLSELAADKLSQELTYCIKAIYGEVKKCIITDLDNTLWGGVIGEEGANGLQLGDSTIGHIYLEIQKILLNYKNKGILLAAVSKNNSQDVMPVFSENKEMILKKDDFVALKINWELKSKNIEEIAKEINLGLDSFVFLDDNPAERLEVAARLPMVEVIDFPTDISKLPAILKNIPAFKTISLTEEDKKRHEMYLQERKRSERQKQLSVGDYLQELGIEIEVKKNDADSIERITQLINKTNQFNLRTQRYTKEQVEEMMRSDNHIISSAKVWDKFGELGLTGVIILEKKKEDDYFIDSFLMSCRILSREIEKQFFIEALKFIGKNKIKISAEYLPSPKNDLVKDFYEKLGFKLESETEKGKNYSLELTRVRKDISWIKVR